MNISRIRFFSIVTLLIAIGVTLTGCDRGLKDTATPLRLGWQPPWANQGQIVQVLKHTDVLSRNKVKVEYKPFTYGGPLTEAALAGGVDILFAGDQPAITLISRDSKWKIVAKMVTYRSAFLVPPGSPAKSLKDLAGKKVAVAFGSTTYRDTIRILTDNGLEVGKDVQLVNLDQAEHAAVIARGGQDRWGEIDAIATYDPTIGVSVKDNQARVLEAWPSPGVVVANEQVIQERADDLKSFLKAYVEAFSIYSRDPNKFDQLYSEESRLPLPPDAYRAMAAYEPNLALPDKSSVNILIDATQRDVLQRNADLALKIGIIKRAVNLGEYINLTLAETAMRESK